MLVPVAFFYGLFVGLWPGLIVGGTRLGFAQVGRWVLFPLTAGAEREWLAASVGKAAHAG